MTTRDLFDAGSPHSPAGFTAWGEALSDQVDQHVAAETAHGWTVDGSGTATWGGAIHTDHDAKYFYPADMHGTAELVGNGGTLQAPPYWSFDPDTPERVKWLWTPGDAWESYTVRFGWVNTGFSSGDVTWRYYERRFVVNGSAAGGGNTLTTPTLVNTLTSTAPALDGNKYQDLAVDVPVTPLTVVLSVLDRHADNAGVDTLSVDAGVYIVTATRT